MAGDFPNLDYNTVAQWPKSSFGALVTRPWFPAYSITLAVVATTILVGRIWAQARKKNVGLGIDDLLISSAWVFAILFTVSCLVGTLDYGFDRHIWDVPPVLYSHAALVQWLSEASFTLSTGITKISVLLFYRRLDPPCSKGFKRIVYVFIALTTCYTVACLLTQILLCRPVAAYWSIPKGSTSAERICTSQHISYLVQGIMGSIATLYTIVVPFLALRNIPTTQFQRTALKVHSLFALTVVGAGVARTVFLVRLVDDPNGDATWNGFNVFVCAQLECHLAIVFASVPFLQRYITRDQRLPARFNTNGEKHDSVISRVSSSLSGQIKRLGRPVGPRELRLDISRPRPQAMEIPDWEFETLESPRQAGSPVGEITYEQYVTGKFGPPAPPKDSRALFEEYRRQHGHMV